MKSTYYTHCAHGRT